MFYVYILKDLCKPFYIGKGQGDRAYSHEKYATGQTELGFGLDKDYNPRKTRKIRKILKEGRQIEYEFIQCETETIAFELEKKLISDFGRRGIDKNGILMNITKGGIGGDTFSGLTDDRKESCRQKRSIASKSRPPAVIEKIRISSLGRTHSDETKKRMSESKTGKNNPMFGKVSSKKGLPATGNNAKGVRQASNRIQIQQLDKDGTIIKTWISMRSVMDDFEVSETQLYRALKLQKELKGFTWRRL